MRKIAFRAWIIDEEKMVYPTKGEHFISLNGSYYALIYNMANPKKMILSKEKDDNVKLMQFTGLCDKNGKKIYCGDICKVHIFTQVPGSDLGISEGEREFKTEIIFNSNGVCFGDTPMILYDGLHEESLEIIGNKFENEELLTKRGK